MVYEASSSKPKFYPLLLRKATKKFEKKTKQKPKAHDKKERNKETTITIIVGGGVEEEGEEDDFVPTVSLTLYETDFDQFVNKLGEAYEKYGFVILENHGVAQTDI